MKAPNQKKLVTLNPEDLFQNIFAMKSNAPMSEDEIIDVLKTMNNAHRANFFIRIPDQSYVVLKDLLPVSDDEAEYRYENAQDLLNANVSKKVKEEYREKLFDFVDLSTLAQRMANADTINIEYQNVINAWCSASFSVVERKKGTITKVDFRVSDLTYDHAEAQELLQMQNTAIASLSKSDIIFVSIIDKVTGASRVIQSRNMIKINRVFDFNEAMKREASHFIESEREDFLKTVTLDNVNEILEAEGHYEKSALLQLPNNGKLRRISYSFTYNNKYPNYILSTTEDVTDEYTLDKVTGMKNFNGFRMDCSYEFSRFAPQQYVLVNFNIANFKAVNTIYGYKAGDKLLKKVLTTLSDCEIPFVSVCRENADNFFCLCRKTDYNYGVLEKLCSIPVNDLNGLKERLELFCGIHFINDGEDLDVMCDKARIARFHAEREIGVNAYVLNEITEHKYFDEATILAAIPEAIKNDELVVYYQPIYNAQSGELASAEALIRWQHPQRGLLLPNVFIPAIERTGQVADVDIYAGEHVYNFQKNRFSLGKKTVPVSVNLSRYDLLHEKYTEYALSVIKARPDIATMVRIEITESGLVNIPAPAEAFLHEVQGSGMKIMIDDFGTGYSSLAALVEHTCDIIKLDSSFASHIGLERRMEVLIKSAIETAHNLEVEVVAEGVETKEQYEFLKAAGCDYIQGYYFSKPVPEDEFIKLLESK